MLKDVKKSGNKKSIIYIIFTVIFCALFCFNSFADLVIEEYFNDLKPEQYIRSIYSNDRKEELKKEEVNYNDIEDLIHLFNPEILNNWNSWENNKSSQDI